MFRSALRFIAGAIVAIAVYVLLTPAYNVVLAVAAQPLVRIDSHLRHLELRAEERRIEGRGDEVRPDMPRAVIPADQLTYNIVLFAGLFATNRNVFRDRALRRLLIALLVLFATHVLAVVLSVESTYAAHIGEWSERNYSDGLQDFWSAAEYSYRLAGMFGIAFACWWLSEPFADKSRG